MVSFYDALNAIYSSTHASIRVNNITSDRFEVTNGLMQGETFSPSLASLFLNDFWHYS